MSDQSEYGDDAVPAIEESVPSSATTKRKRKRKRKQADNEKDSDTPAEPEPNDPVATLDRTVYVEGIPFDCTNDEVREFFTSALNLTDVVDLRLPQWQDSGRLRGFGHIVFKSKESRDEAISQSRKHYLRNRYVTIQEAKPPSVDAAISRPLRPQPVNCRTIFCRNLPFSATKEDIENLFRSCGKIVEGGVRIAWNYHTRQSKGFCYVEFKHPEGAYAAVTNQPWKLQGRVCQIDYDEGSIKGSYKTEEGRLWRKEYHQPKEAYHASSNEAKETKSTKKRKSSEENC